MSMNSRISFIYKILLFTCIISSGVLFIIVAADHGINIGKLHQETQDTRNGESKKLEVEKAVHVKPVDFDSSRFERLNDEERQLDQQIRSSFDEVPSEELKEQQLKAEAGSLFQNQASITDEFSETGEAVVLTLVDSASQELQQQAAVVTKLLAAGADAANQSAHTKVVAAAAAAAAAGPVTVPLPLQSDANQTNQDDDDLYVVRAEPKQVDATSQPTRASEQQPSSDGVGSQPKSGNEGTTASESLLPSQDTVVEDVIVGGEGQEKVGTKSNETGVVNSTSGGSAGGGGGAGEVVSSSHEEIPSFSEWAQKQLAEAEKKKSENKTRGSGAGGAGGGVGGGAGGAVKRGSKQRSKNYASPDCGAKVVSTNPEASSVWAVLSTSRDEYLLNSCHNKIWFVVELCEAIQPEKIELANFELFSSILREFSVSVSDRHPSREWSGVGQMEAREVRTVQSFSLQPTSAFVKYIRVEFHSHYGAEHYCPISLFRVYGTSEFEVLDTVDEAHAAVASLEEEEEEEFDDEEAGVGGGEGVEKPRNLFSSARDAVLSIVKRAAQALGKGDGGEGGVGSGSLEGQGNSSVGEGDATALVNCVTPAHIIVCDNCSDALYNRVHHELSCHLLALERVLGWEWGGAAVAGSGACKARGLGGGGGAPFPMLARTSPAPLAAHPSSHYLHAMLPEHTIIALCNLLAIKRKQVVLNITYDLSKDFEEKLGESLGEAATVAPLMPLTSASPSTCTVNSTTAASSASQDAGSGSGATGSKDSQSASNTQIKPTKTFLAEDMHSLPVDADVSNLNTTSDGEGLNATTVADTVPVVTASSAPVKATTEDQTATATESLGSEESMLDFPEEAAGGGLTFDSIFSELDEVESADPVAATTTSTTQPTKLSPPQTQQRESVFLRLAKRIKALERNMSLSGQYLEELSRRYKRQVEEMQRSLNEVVEERRRQEERELRRGEQVATLTRQLTKLTSTMEALIEERNSWAIKHGAVIVVEVVVFAVILLLCRCLPDAVELGGRSRRLVAWQRSAPSGSSAAPRRSSVDGSSRPYPPNPRLRKRRPSEEALRISGSTHEDLLIPDASRKNSRAENRRRRRKKKEQQAAAATTTTFYVDVDTSSSSSVRQMAAGPPPPPPPLPPPVVAVRPVVAAPAERRSYIVPVTVNGGDPSSLPAPPSILAPPSPPNYVQTALSIRKKRKESLRGQSSSEFSDSSAPSASSAMLNNLSSPSLLAKKSGPLKKIIKKLF